MDNAEFSKLTKLLPCKRTDEEHRSSGQIMWYLGQFGKSTNFENKINIPFSLFTFEQFAYSLSVSCVTSVVNVQESGLQRKFFCASIRSLD